MKPIISADEAARLVQPGATVMIGGFLKCGSPTEVIQALLALGVSGLTLIGNDTSFIDSDRGLLIAHHRVKKAIVSHIGTNPETGRQMHSGELDVELVPQGTLVERIRCAGAGLGGVLTPTGVGTVVAEDKQVVCVDGRDYLLEKPLSADVALIYGTTADKFGNISFYGSTRNFNPIMALAGKTVIAEVDCLSDVTLDPNEIAIPGVLVDYVVVRQHSADEMKE